MYPKTTTLHDASEGVNAHGHLLAAVDTHLVIGVATAAVVNHAFVRVPHRKLRPPQTTATMWHSRSESDVVNANGPPCLRVHLPVQRLLAEMATILEPADTPESVVECTVEPPPI